MIKHIPNFISILRLILSPFVYVFIHQKDFPNALILFSFLSITDALDGFLARITNSVTTLGKILDPISDKVLILLSLYALSDSSIKRSIPFLSFKLMFFRDLFILLGSLFFLSKNVVPVSRVLGKITTFFAMFVVIFFVFENAFYFNFSYDKALYIILDILIILSFLDYGQYFFNRFREVSYGRTNRRSN